jgi:hypothetical protein
MRMQNSRCTVHMYSGVLHMCICEGRQTVRVLCCMLLRQLGGVLLDI